MWHDVVEARHEPEFYHQPFKAPHLKPDLLCLIWTDNQIIHCCHCVLRSWWFTTLGFFLEKRQSICLSKAMVGVNSWNSKEHPFPSFCCLDGSKWTGQARGLQREKWLMAIYLQLGICQKSPGHENQAELSFGHLIKEIMGTHMCRLGESKNS